MLERYLTPWRIRWYSASILLAIFLDFMICAFYGTGSVTYDKTPGRIAEEKLRDYFLYGKSV